MAKRPITATLHRRHPGERFSTVVWTRYYSRFKNAHRKASEIALEEAQPGDVIEFISTEHRFPIATTKIGLYGDTKTELSEEMRKEWVARAQLNAKSKFNRN